MWVFVLFLIYVTASEFSHLFGSGELRRLFFTSRPSDLQLNRRQRIRELLRLSRLADAYSADEFRDPTSAAHRQLFEIVRQVAQQSLWLRRSFGTEMAPSQVLATAWRRR